MMPSAQSLPEEGTYVSANGINIHLWELGSGVPLLLLHGGMGTARDNFSAAMPELSPHFRVIAPDSRGHGRTRNPGNRPSYSQMADDTAALIEALHLERPFICGWSDGGQIALDLGIRYPELAAALVVGGAFIRFSEQYLKLLDGIGLLGPGSVDFARLQESIPDAATHWQELHSIQGEDHWKDLFLAASYLARTPLPYSELDLPRILAPTLILLGDRDQFIPVEQSLEMYRLIPNSELAVIPNSDHSLRNNTAVFSQVVLEFLLRKNARQ